MGSDIYHKATEWDIAFCGYRMRTNSGTSGIGQGGAADLGYGEYDKWTSKAQVDAYMLEHGLKFEVDDSASVYITMSQNDWNKYCIKNHLDFNKYDANVEIGDEGGCMSYYMEELK